MSRITRTVFVVPAAAVLLVTLAACRSNAVKAAPDAAAPGCSALSSRLPAQVLNRSRKPLAVTGAASWGDPAIVLRCGVTPPGPTATGCLEFDGLDWVFSEMKNTFQFVTFGRTPAVEVRVPAAVGRTEAPGALIDLAPAVRPIKQATRCS